LDTGKAHRDALAETTLLGHVGEPYLDYTVLSSVTQMRASLTNGIWENIVLEESRNITSFLARMHPAEDQKWNDLARSAKAFLHQKMEGKISRLITTHVLSDEDADFVRFDLVNLLVMDNYRPYVTSGFFDQLADIYINGHIPCGWNGEHPAGSIIIY
jgi:hypothetical protein